MQPDGTFFVLRPLIVVGLGTKGVIDQACGHRGPRKLDSQPFLSPGCPALESVFFCLPWPTLSPGLLPEEPEKYRRLLNIPGFGPNSASGLVMVFHPDGFALWSKRSQAAALHFGIASMPIEVSGTDGRRKRMSHDFIELEWFLYLLMVKDGCGWMCTKMP